MDPSEVLPEMSPDPLVPPPPHRYTRLSTSPLPPGP
jgi:hypothetical protein